jgi:UDP-3-O-[3-hydroxymyristoyl] N-acetylglucosamine deacetylase
MSLQTAAENSFQQTIVKAVETHGIGLHTAVKSHVRLLPAPPGTGIVFRRTDLDGFQIEAHIRNVARVSYATSLMKQGVLLSTTEHILAAIYACGIDNIYIEIDALELPILDGSAQPYIEMLDRAGLRRQKRRRTYLKAVKSMEVSDGDRRIGIYPNSEFRVTCFVDYSHPKVGRQEVELAVNSATFRRELAVARTFGFLSDFDGLRAMGLIRGGTLENAIVLTADDVMNGPVRFPDEFVRHKALDLIGDLALIGKPLQAHVVAHKAGHSLHTQFVTRLLAESSLWVETHAPEAPQPAKSTLRPRFSHPAHATD